MFQSGLHFGHKVSKKHPKMEPFIFTQKNSINIINLEITQQKLKEALDFIKDVVRRNGTVLFVGTRKQAQKNIQECAKRCLSPYISERWLGGTFTNFVEIQKLIKKYTEIKRKKQTGELAKYTKKEQLKFDKVTVKLDLMVGGIESMNTLPNAIFILDIRREKSALAEARKKKIPIIAVCDTNVIPENDDSVKGIQMITQLVSDAVLEGQAERNKK